MAWQDRDYNREDTGSPLRTHLTGMSITFWLIGINCVVFLLDSILTFSRRADFISPSYWCLYSFDLAIGQLQLWRLFTYQFIHGDVLHLLFNMIGLFFFGPMLEQWWGRRRYLAFYLLCGVSGAIIYSGLGAVPSLLGTNIHSALVGASGSIFGILVGCAVLFPRQRISLIFPPIPMSMRTLAVVFLTIEAVMIAVGAQGSGAAAAHLGGAAFGFVLVKFPRALNFANHFSIRTFDRLKDNRRRRRREKERLRYEREEAEVDRILVKVKEFGLHALTEREKRTLQRATENKRQAG